MPGGHGALVRCSTNACTGMNVCALHWHVGVTSLPPPDLSTGVLLATWWCDPFPRPPACFAYRSHPAGHPAAPAAAAAAAPHHHVWHAAAAAPAGATRRRPALCSARRPNGAGVQPAAPAGESALAPSRAASLPPGLPPATAKSCCWQSSWPILALLAPLGAELAGAPRLGPALIPSALLLELPPPPLLLATCC